MKNFFHRLFIFALLVHLSFCGSEDSSTKFPDRSRYSQDTVFVGLKVNNSNRDSLQKIYGSFVEAEDQLLLDQGEFISASINFTVPLYPVGWVNDFESLFAVAEENYLDSTLLSYENKTGNEIAVITIDSSWTTRADFDQFVLRLHKFWGVGKREQDNGIVIGICRGYQMIRISRGKAHVDKLTEAETKKVTDIMISGFVRDAFFEGTRKGIIAIMNELDASATGKTD